MTTIVEWFESWTNNGTLAILFFPIFAGFLVYCSIRLVKWAEVIIAKTKFGGGFVGGALIASVTSFPEMITEITQALEGKPENGIGDDIGSNAFSAFLIAIGAIAFVRYSFLNSLGKWTKITIAISGGLSIILSLFLFFNKDVSLGGYMGIIPLSFFIFYIVAQFLQYKFGDEDEPVNLDVEVHNKKIQNASVKKAFLHFWIWAMFLVVSALLVNITISAFQNGTGIGTQSIGGVFLAITTSLPEIIAFFLFLRKKQPAAAVASLVGSHFFNLGILFLGDIAYGSPTFNKPEMQNHYPLAILTGLMMLLIVLHCLIAWKKPKLMEKKWVYVTIPIIVIISYIIGWVLILAFPIIG